jgi:hypothetical protein
MGYQGLGKGLGALGGIWEDTQAWLMGTLPTWMTGVTPVDVSPGPAGVEELRAMADELNGKKVLLSARAQMALWAIMEEEANEIDALYLETADIEGPQGEAIRLALEAARQDLLERGEALVAMNVEAERQGVPLADPADWYPPGSERTGSISERTAGPAAGALANPSLWGILIVVGVVIAAVAVGTAIYVTVNNKFSLEEMRLGIETLKGTGATPQEIGNYMLSRIQAEAPKGKFPWGWVIGIGASALGIVFLVAYAEGSLQRWTQSLRSPGARRMF